MRYRLAIIFLLAAPPGLCAGGCKEGLFAQPFSIKQTNAATIAQAPAAGSQAIASQVQDLNRRVSQLDVNNADLHRQLAQAEQMRQTSQEQVSLLQKQLGEMAARLKDTQVAKAEVEK